jgi:hypothetical protein
MASTSTNRFVSFLGFNAVVRKNVSVEDKQNFPGLQATASTAPRESRTRDRPAASEASCKLVSPETKQNSSLSSENESEEGGCHGRAGQVKK